MRVRGALVLGSVLVVLVSFVRGQEDGPVSTTTTNFTVVESVEPLLTVQQYYQTLEASVQADYIQAPDVLCIPQINSYERCPSYCKSSRRDCRATERCQRNDCGGCVCKSRFKCIPDDKITCPPNRCFDDNTCVKKYGAGATCQKKRCGACDCVPPPRCIPKLPLAHWGCPNDCRTTADCKNKDLHVCRNNPCGGCHCLPKEPKKKDCCIENRTGSCPMDCEYDKQCGPRGVCVATRNCTGGCMCDYGEGCFPTVKPSPTCPAECKFDRDCRTITGGNCVKIPCGGCRCVPPDKAGCCPDRYMKPGCPKDCEKHSDCKDRRKLCRRNDCGGCHCVFGEVPPWLNCVKNPNQIPGIFCPEVCQTHADCYRLTQNRGARCARTKCGGCECKVPTIDDLVVYRDFDKPVFAAANATDQREPAGSVENATVIQQG